MPTVEQGPKSGQRPSASTPTEPLPPEVIADCERAWDELDEHDGPPTERRSRALSSLAIRSDGAYLVSTEDAADLNLEGRELQMFMVLHDDERAFVLDSAREFLDDRAARVLGKLPRRTT